MNENLKQVLAEYVSNALVHVEAGEETDFKRANLAYDKYVAALKKLRAAGEEGRRALLGLLDHESDAVKAKAATHLLKTDQKKALRVLKRIAKLPTILGIDSRTVLEEWKKGRLETP